MNNASEQSQKKVGATPAQANVQTYEKPEIVDLGRLADATRGTAGATIDALGS